ERGSSSWTAFRLGVQAKRVFLIPATLGLLAAAVASALAEDLYDTTWAQWIDPLTPPRTRVRCSKEASGKFSPIGPEWKTCVGWSVDTSNMQCTVRLHVLRPDSLSEELLQRARDTARGCASVARGTRNSGLAGTPSAEL